MFSIDAGLLAQVHWDVGAAAGVMQRETAGRAAGAPEPSPGPMLEAHAHIAIVPMLRAGPYLSYDASLGAVARHTAEAGLRAKLTPPVMAAPWHAWALVGLGAARSYLPSHWISGPPPGEVGGSEGGMLDASVGLGVGARVRGPWSLFAELQSRIGVAFWGAMYDDKACACAHDPYPGRDSFAVSRSLGVSLDP